MVDKMKAININIAINGLGTVTQLFLTILHTKKQRITQQHGIEFTLVCIADSSGVAVNPTGFDITELIEFKKSHRKVKELTSFQASTSMLEMMERKTIDLLIEASPANLETGGDALIIIKAALKNNISVVSANKSPLVIAFDEIIKIASDSRGDIKYSATCCGGMPIINVGQRDLIAADITLLTGVLNNTSNYILEKMATGEPYKTALSHAQKNGIAEANPSVDVDGWDTASKLIIIANSLLDMNASLSDVNVEGIANITPAMLKQAQNDDSVIKLVARAEQNHLSVKPTILPKHHFLAQCGPGEKAIEIHSDLFGVSYYKVQENEPTPTAAAMLRDSVNLFSLHRM